jgi:hypothetical protein
MTDTPKRRFWRIHLSTAVVMMVLSSLLVWANVRVRYYLFQKIGPCNARGVHEDERTAQYIGYEVGAYLGWPLGVGGYGNGVIAPKENPEVALEAECRAYLFEHLKIGHVIPNLVINIAIVILTGALVERLIRRRARP